MITRYQGRLSDPLLDRIDLHVDVPRVEYDKLMSDKRAETSATVRQRVESAREHQRKRFAGRAGLYANADMGVSEIQQLCYLSTEAKQLLEISTKRMQLSARSYHRVIKLSRTIADLEESVEIKKEHILEAVEYRPKKFDI